MRRQVLVFYFSFYLLSLFSQSSYKVYSKYQIPELDRTFQMVHELNPDYEIVGDGHGKLYYEDAGATRHSMEKARPVNMKILVLDQDGNEVWKFEMDYNDVDIDLSRFQVHYVGTRKFVVFTAGRSRFYILTYRQT